VRKDGKFSRIAEEYERQRQRFRDILLEPIQKSLLIQLVEIVKSIPRNKLQKFIVIRAVQGDIISCPNHKQIEAYFGDIETLDREGLIALSKDSRSSGFDIAPKGIEYYNYLKETDQTEKIRESQDNRKANQTIEPKFDILEKKEGELEPKPPEFLQNLLWVIKYGKKYWKLIILAIIVLSAFFCFKQYPSRIPNIFADINKEGIILKSKNFPWEISKTKNEEGNILYTLVDRGGDATAISVIPDNPKYTVYQSYDGMVIKYTCAEEKIPNFRIIVKY
jgi:hypothetical protein